ncbi:MAG: hypothetical protein FWD61_20495 [Phycisphaerales bacterium]|nr:hypothetical protein [Phycisphaerales bacterium]
MAAAKMASIYGLNRTVKTLRLDYYALKKRVESSPKKRGKRRVASTADRSKSGVLKSVDLQKSGGVRFVELANSLQTGGCECCVEWEDAAGAKMRVHLKGSAAQAGLAMPDLAALSRSFWEDPTS